MEDHPEPAEGDENVTSASQNLPYNGSQEQRSRTPMSIMKEGSTPPLLNSNCPMVWFPPSGFEEQLRLQTGLPRFEDVPTRCNFSYYLDALSSYNAVQVQPSETLIKKEKDDAQFSEEDQEVERRRARWRAAHRRRAERKKEELRKQLEEEEVERQLEDEKQRLAEKKREGWRAQYVRRKERYANTIRERMTDPEYAERKRAQWRAANKRRWAARKEPQSQLSSSSKLKVKHAIQARMADPAYAEKRRAQWRAANKRRWAAIKESRSQSSSSSSNPKGRIKVKVKPKGRSRPRPPNKKNQKVFISPQNKEAQPSKTSTRKSSRHKDNPPPNYSEP